MSRSNHPLTPLQARKQLLVLEAELQREQFCADIESLSEHVHGAARKAASLGSLASVAALVAGGVSMFRGGGHGNNGNEKPGMISRLVSMAKFAGSAWLMMRSRS